MDEPKLEPGLLGYVFDFGFNDFDVVDA